MTFEPAPPPAVFVVTAWMSGTALIARARYSEPGQWDAPHAERLLADRASILSALADWLDAIATATPP